MALSYNNAKTVSQLMHLRRQLLDWKDVFPTKASDPKQGEKELLVIKNV